MNSITSNKDYQLLFKFRLKKGEDSSGVGVWLYNGFMTSLCPKSWWDYFNGLQDYCNMKDPRIIYNGQDEEFYVYTKIAEENKEEIVKKCLEFNFPDNEAPFSITSYSDISPYKPQNEIGKSLMTFFEHSLINGYLKKQTSPFFNDLNNDADVFDLKHFFKAYVLIEKAIYPTFKKMIINGQISIRDALGIKGTMRYCEINDIGEVTSEIKEENDEVAVVTKIKLKRALEINPQGLICTAAPFYELLMKDGDYLTCTDHFVIIASGTRLLHYCDEYHCFEVFDLPNEWNFNMGITEEIYASRKIFTDSIFDEQDPDIKEIYAILDSRKIKKHYSS